MKKYRKFLKRFIEFYKDETDELYLCRTLQEFKEKHIILAWYYRAELNMLKASIQSMLLYGPDSGFLFADDWPNRIIGKEKRINLLNEMQYLGV